jgi:hypothetical protein
MATSCDAPSASACSWRVRSWQIAMRASVNSAWSASTPLAPEPSRLTVSLVGHAAVGVEPVEGDAGGLAERGVEPGGGDHGVGGDHDQHGGQAWGEHAGALRHAADGPAGRRAVLGLLGLRVGGHDGLRGGESGLRRGCGVTLEGDGRFPDAGPELVEIELFADQPGRADEHVAGGNLQAGGDCLSGRVRGLEADPAGVAVGAARIEDDRADDAVCHHLLAPDHRVGLAAVAREHGGRVPERPEILHHGQVEAAGLLQSGGHSGGGES